MGVSLGSLPIRPWLRRVGDRLNRRTWRSLALGLGSSLWIACQPAPVPPPPLTPYTPDTGGFTIASPQPLATEQELVETPLGDIEIFTFTTEMAEVVYGVAYSDYPEAIAADLDPQTILDGSRDGAVANVQGTLIQERSIRLEEHPGRELIIDASPNTESSARVTVRLYLVENRLYQVLVVIPTDHPDPGNTEAFLDSFTLTP